MPSRFLPRLSALLLIASLFLGTHTAFAKTYTALGAEEVHGVGAANATTEGYVSLLGNWLNSRASAGVSYTVRKRAKSGFTVPELVNNDYDDSLPGTQLAITDMLADDPDIVTVSVGVNDVWQMALPLQYPNSPYSNFAPGIDPTALSPKLDYFRLHLRQIFAALKQGNPNRKVLVANLPDLGGISASSITWPLSAEEEELMHRLNMLSFAVSSSINFEAQNAGISLVDSPTSPIFTPTDFTPTDQLNTSGHAKLAKLFEAKLANGKDLDLVVDTLADTTNASDGLTSLREAITLANSTARPGADTIRFAEGITGTISLNSALPLLKEQLIIQGPGARQLTVRRSDSATTGFQIFIIPFDAELTISDLTISHGNSTPTPINSETYYQNKGNGIYNGGMLVARNCTLRDNIGTAIRGGAIYATGPVTLENCTISDNKATHYGGGLYLAAESTLRNCTISGNETALGGGILAAGGLLKIQNCTVTRNKTISPFVYAGNGSGIFTLPEIRALDLQVTNSIIAGNSGGPKNGTDIGFDGGKITSGGYNLIGSLGSHILEIASNPFTGPEDVAGIADPLLGPLQNNGGPTDTHNVSKLSLAHNTGHPTIVDGTDQRGEGYPRVQDGRIDRGAVELEPVGTAFNESLTVTTLADENDDTSDSSFGQGTSLREAILYASKHSGADTITFDNRLFFNGNSAVINLNDALPELMGEVVLQGPSARLLTIQRPYNSLLRFGILRVTFGASVTISGLTINNGLLALNADAEDLNHYGAGIYNRGNLVVQNCIFQDNVAVGGGAVGTIMPGTLLLENSTIARNAANTGGGLYSLGAGITIRNCTFSGNTASLGGGISIGGGSNNKIQNCTITQNIRGSSDTSTASGSGLYAISGTTIITNNIVAGNFVYAGGNMLGGDIGAAKVENVHQGRFQSAGYNIIGELNVNSTGFSTSSGDVTGITNPKLGPLQNNGGSTETHRLLPGSPAINIGGMTDLTNDQRGVGYPRTVNALDAGAYELESSDESLIVTTLTDENDGTSAPAYGTGTSLREAINYANTHLGADTITFSENLFPNGVAHTINLESVLPDLNSELTIEGPGARILTVRRSATTTAKFSIFNVLATGAVKISGLTVSHGNPTNNQGGAIANTGILEVNACTIRDSSSGLGGGIGNTGRLTVTNSTITGNIARGYGGGIYSDAIANPTVSYARIINCTISSNHSNSAGGAVVNRSGLMEIRNSTLTLNTSTTSPGVHNLLSSARTKLANSIVAGNLQNSAPGGDTLYSGTTNTFESQGYNIIGLGNGSAAFTANSDVKGVTVPGLLPLANNGGPTDTHALLLTSPALNIGGTTSLTTDQRGAGFPRHHAALDAGAYELQQLPPTTANFTQMVNRNTPQVLTLPATDPEGDTLTFTIVKQPRYGTLSAISSNSITYTPNTNFSGVDAFTFKANDGQFDSNLATATLKVYATPTLENLTLATLDGTVTSSGSAIEANTPRKLTLTVKDEDGANNIRMIYLILNKAQAHNNGASLEYDPGTNKIALRNAQGQLVAGQVAGTTGTYSNGFVTLDFDQSSVVKDVTNKTITVTWAITPSPSFIGLKGAWAQTRDVQGLAAGFDKLGEWTVLPPYVSKVQALDAVSVLRPGVASLALTLPVTNPEAKPLTFSIVDGPANGSLGVITNNRVVYTPGPGFAAVGRDTFTFRAYDGQGYSNTATYIVKYNGAPQLGQLIIEKVNGPTTSSSSTVGEPLRLTLTVGDEDGADNIRMLYLLFNKAQSHSNGASLEYDPGTNRIALRNAQGQLIAGQVAGTAGTQSNGLVTLDFGLSSVVKNTVDRTITVSWVVTPLTSFTGLKGAWAQTRDIGGLSDGFDKLGEWTITPAPPALRTKTSKPSTTTY